MVGNIPQEKPNDKMRISIAAALVSLLSLASPAAGATITLQPTEVLQITFSTYGGSNCGLLSACDTLIFDLDFKNNSNGANITTAALFDSSTLLGTFRNDQTCLTLGTCAGLVPSFVASASVYGLGSPVIDFASILNGTIHGVLDITLNQPISFDPDLDPTLNFFTVTSATGTGTGNGGYFKGFDSIVILPEPSSSTFLALGLASLVACYRRKRSPESR